MENQKSEQSDPSTPSVSPGPLDLKPYLLSIGVLVVIFFLSAMFGSAEIIKAVNVALVVGVLALGMKFGFAWVTAASESDPTSPTIVATRPDALQAAPLISTLQENGINAVATGSHTAGFQVEIASEVKVVVPKSDAAKAIEILGDAVKG